MSSLDRILPFLKPIEDLLRDPTVTEVMVNAGGSRVFVERHGTVEAVSDRTLEPRNLTVAIKNIARACGDEISDAQPLLDARLEDGSRVAAMFPPCAVAGPVLTIRKFTRRYSLDDLVAIDSLTADTALLTAVANDYGYPDVFARQVRALGRPGDLLLLFSTSGESENVVRAAAAARTRGVTTVAVTSERQSRLARAADLSVRVPVTDTAVVQELHMLVTHVLCDVAEAELAQAAERR